jgi:hypothetical protein
MTGVRERFLFIYFKSLVTTQVFRSQNEKIQKIRFFNITQETLEESSRYSISVHDLAYGYVSNPTRLIEEAGKSLEACMRAILNSDS